MKRTRLMNQLTNNENMESSEKTTEQRPIRTLIVEAVGEATARPDTSHLLITVSSQKASVTDAKISVDRRVEYIDQVIHNNQIKVSEQWLSRRMLHSYVQCSCRVFQQLRVSMGHHEWVIVNMRS